MRNVVMFSGGIGSWATARRVKAEHGVTGLVLLFADTMMEDEDTYAFLDAASTEIGGEFIRLADGRDIWQVFRDVKFLGNSRIDPCSRVLKRELMRKWVDENCDPANTTVYVGIDWTEAHRAELGKDITILRDRTGGKSRPISLREFRERLQRQPELFDSDEWGGCACTVPMDDELRA